MIGLRKLMSTLSSEIVEIIGDPTLQVIDRKYLDNIPKGMLRTPRVIVDLLGVKDSEFYYSYEEFKDDELNLYTNRISNIDVSVSFISDFNDDKAEYMAEMFRDYYMSRHTKKLKEYNAVLTSTPDIQDINSWIQKKDVNIIRVRLSFRIDNFCNYKPFKNGEGYAERAVGTLETEGVDLEFKN